MINGGGTRPCGCCQTWTGVARCSKKVAGGSNKEQADKQHPSMVSASVHASVFSHA